MHFLKKYALFCVKDANFFAKRFGENNVKIIASDPSEFYISSNAVDTLSIW
jgi:hypothetical protein